jgi:hypothetical protein
MLPERTTTIGELDAEATDSPFHSINAVDRTCLSSKTVVSPVLGWRERRNDPSSKGRKVCEQETPHTKAKLSTCATVVRALFKLEESEDSMMGILPGAEDGCQMCSSRALL